MYNAAHWFTRWDKEVIAIRKQDKNMNRDKGQYNLSHLYDDFLKSSRNTNILSKQPSISVANTTAKPRNWATFDPAAAGKKLAPRFANPIPVNVISMG